MVFVPVAAVRSRSKGLEIDTEKFLSAYQKHLIGEAPVQRNGPSMPNDSLKTDPPGSSRSGHAGDAQRTFGCSCMYVTLGQIQSCALSRFTSGSQKTINSHPVASGRTSPQSSK